MINVEHKRFKKQYLNKSFYNSNNEKISINDIVEYNGIGLYKIVFDIGFNNNTQYLHDISEIELTDFLSELKTNKKLIEKEMNKTDNKTQSQNDLDKLKDILFMTLNDVIDDGITCEKANTVSKVAQTILNLEKLNQKK
jgi:hypothetical protein